MLFENSSSTPAGRPQRERTMTSTLARERTMLRIDQTLSGSKAGSDLDPISEMQLRTWARTNYCSPADRESDWHPVILDEMARRDAELNLA